MGVSWVGAGGVKAFLKTKTCETAKEVLGFSKGRKAIST